MKDASRTLRLITTRRWRRKVMSEPPTRPQVPRFGIAHMPVSRELTPAGTSAHSRLPCKSLSSGTRTLPGALARARDTKLLRTHSSHECLSAEVPAFAEPDIHSLSQAPEGRHRRLSLCSLPVPKQYGESLRSESPSLSRQPRDLAACALWNPDVVQAAFKLPCGCTLLPARSSALCDPQPADTPLFFELQPASLD